MAMTAQTRQPQMGLTFEKVWAMFQEMSQGADKGIQKTDWDIEELPESFDDVDISQWELVEKLKPAHLLKKFEALGFDFNQSFQNHSVGDKTQYHVEVEMMLLNETIGVVVESKPTMTQSDIDEYETRMEILSHDPKSPFAYLKLHGARAFVKASKVEQQYARDKGFFVIELTGDTIKIDMPEGWTPKTW
jgi:hypothetical protein